MVYKLLRILFAIGLVTLLVACSTSKKQAAPIVDLRSELELKQGYHIVTPGETIYFIAWRFGMDYRQLAAKNNLTPPYALEVGDKLILKGKAKHYPYQVPQQPGAKTVVPSVLPPADLHPVSRWTWPAKGKVIQNFSSQNKGVNISGAFNEPVRAVAAGQVVYAGDGLRSYGNLILIKHNDIYLSAYAHNEVLLVKEGQMVGAGELIAKMGSSGTDRVMLHFELRKRGKAVDPLKYLP